MSESLLGYFTLLRDVNNWTRYSVPEGHPPSPCITSAPSTSALQWREGDLLVVGYDVIGVFSKKPQGLTAGRNDVVIPRGTLVSIYRDDRDALPYVMIVDDRMKARGWVGYMSTPLLTPVLKGLRDLGEGYSIGNVPVLPDTR